MPEFTAALLGAALGVAATVAAQHIRARRGPPVAPLPRSAAPPEDGTGGPPGFEPAEALRLGCALAQRAVGADEVVLWRLDETRATRLAWAGDSAREPPTTVALEGHPFRWIAAENVHLRLERGRRALPSPWAETMLLLPVGTKAVAAFAFATPPPAGAERAAVLARDALAHLYDLSLAYEASRGADKRLATLLDLVDRLSAATSVAAAARLLADAARAALRADGVLLVDWQESDGIVRLVVDDVGSPALGEGATVEAPSHVTWAARHMQPLVVDGLSSTRPLPLVTPGERWSRSPRAALLAPLVSGETTVAVIAVWRYDGPPFVSADTEFLRLLGHLGATTWRTARQLDDLNRRASTDPLTGLPNRSAFETRLASLVHHHQRYARPFALVVMDIDHFKQCNDTWGHDAGDRVLRHVGRLLQANVREVDLPARLGGEEFVVLMPETRLAEALEAADRLRRALEAQPIVWQGQRLAVTASFGVAACPETACTAERLLAAADRALYRAKSSGRNCVRAAASVGRGIDTDAAAP